MYPGEGQSLTINREVSLITLLIYYLLKPDEYEGVLTLLRSSIEQIKKIHLKVGIEIFRLKYKETLCF